MPDTSPRFTEIAPRVWVAHYDWMHVNVTLVGGSDGVLMVDTHGSAEAARVVADDVRRLGAGPLTGLVNTHEHWDHHFGNATMVEQFGEMPIHATEWARDHIEESAHRTFELYEQAPRQRARAGGSGPLPPRRQSCSKSPGLGKPERLWDKFSTGSQWSDNCTRPNKCQQC